MLELLKLASIIALPTKPNDYRGFWMGGVAIRNDGAIVKSKNGCIDDSTNYPKHKRFPSAHVEYRLLKKAGDNAILYVVRVSKKTHELALARPCEICLPLMKNHKVKKCYYSISPYEYGIIDFTYYDFEKIKTINKPIRLK